MRPIIVRLTEVSVLVLIVLLVRGCASDSPLWQRHPEKDFPAPVNSIVTHLGDFIDAKHVVTYGTWTVGFGKDEPHASYNCPQDTTCHIMISNLRCDRSSGGSAACGLKLYENSTCRLIIPERQEAFQIHCPYDVSLGPKKGDDKAKTTKASAK